MTLGFLLFNTCSFINTFSLRLFQVAIAWLVLEITGSPQKLSYVVGLSVFFEIAANFAFGWLGDRRNRKRIYQVATGMSAFAAVGFVILLYLDTVSIVGFLVISSLMGIASGIRMPIEGSFVPELVPNSELSRAIRIKATYFALGSILGASIAGLIIDTFSMLAAGFTSLALYFFSLILLHWVNPIKASCREVPDDSGATLLDKLFSGARILFHTKSELYLALLSTVVNFAIFPLFFLLLPAFVKLHIEGTAFDLGVIEAGFSLGVLVGSAVLIGVINRLLGRFFAMTIGLLLLAMTLVSFRFFEMQVLLTVIMFFGGVGLMLFNINASITRTMATPNSHQSRLFSSVIVISSIANPVSVYLTGLLVERIGITGCILIYGVALFLCACLMWTIPHYRSIMALSDEKAFEKYVELYPKAFLR